MPKYMARPRAAVPAARGAAAGALVLLLCGSPHCIAAQLTSSSETVPQCAWSGSRCGLSSGAGEGRTRGPDEAGPDSLARNLPPARALQQAASLGPPRASDVLAPAGVDPWYPTLCSLSQQSLSGFQARFPEFPLLAPPPPSVAPAAFVAGLPALLPGLKSSLADGASAAPASGEDFSSGAVSPGTSPDAAAPSSRAARTAAARAGAPGASTAMAADAGSGSFVSAASSGAVVGGDLAASRLQLLAAVTAHAAKDAACGLRAAAAECTAAEAAGAASACTWDPLVRTKEGP
jgi:hypothetical protein